MITNSYNYDPRFGPNLLDEPNWFERAVHFHGLNKAVTALLQHPNDQRDWEALRRFVVDKPYGPEHMEAYLAMRAQQEPQHLALATAIRVGIDGSQHGLDWAMAILVLFPGHAKTLAGDSAWLREVFDDSESRLAMEMARNHTWKPLWDAMARRWQGQEVLKVLDSLPPQDRARELLGVGIVHQLGVGNIRWNLDFIEAVNRRLGGALTIQPHLSDLLDKRPFMGRLVAAVHKSVLEQESHSDTARNPDAKTPPKM